MNNPMFMAGHLGIGLTLAKPFGRGLSKQTILLGTILPDIIDKSLYYGLSAITGKHGAELGVICGTRTFGHTGIFLIVLTSLALARRSKILAALILGVASHSILDSLFSHLTVPYQTPVPLLWPLPGWEFRVIQCRNASQHFQQVIQPEIFWSELVGAILLLREYSLTRLDFRFRSQK